MTGARTYHHGDLPGELVRIARDLVRQSGPDGCSMREVSRRAGVSQTAPYRHFADKAALLEAVGRDAYAELERRYRRAIRACPDPDRQAAAVCRSYLKFALDEPALFRLIFSSPRLHGTPEAVSSYRVFEQAIAAAQARGGFAGGSAAEVAHALWAAVHGVADLVLSGSFSRRHGLEVAERLLAMTLPSAQR